MLLSTVVTSLITSTIFQYCSSEILKPVCRNGDHRYGKWIYDTELIRRGKQFYCCGDGDDKNVTTDHNKRCADVDYMIHHGIFYNFM